MCGKRIAGSYQLCCFKPISRRRIFPLNSGSSAWSPLHGGWYWTRFWARRVQSHATNGQNETDSDFDFLCSGWARAHTIGAHCSVIVKLRAEYVRLFACFQRRRRRRRRFTKILAFIVQSDGDVVNQRSHRTAQQSKRKPGQTKWNGTEKCLYGGGRRCAQKYIYEQECAMFNAVVDYVNF